MCMTWHIRDFYGSHYTKIFLASARILAIEFFHFLSLLGIYKLKNRSYRQPMYYLAWALSYGHGSQTEGSQRRHTDICISRREIKSQMSLLERRQFEIWEHSWMPKVNYTISQMFQELLFLFFFFFAWRKILVHKENNEQKLLLQKCSWLFKMRPFENNQRGAQWFIEKVVHFSVIYHVLNAETF